MKTLMCLFVHVEYLYICVFIKLLFNCPHTCVCVSIDLHNCFVCVIKCVCVCDQDNIGELDTDRQEELKGVRRHNEEEEEKGRKSALLFGSEDTFDSIAAVEEKVCISSV